VISVGNITAGGTGKTPIVAHLAELLANRGLQPAVLLRGYKGDRPGGSDELALLTRRLSGVPIVGDPDRVAAARRLIAEQPAVDFILLDDGFQHRRIGRDLDLVLIDATDPFGMGHVLPRGRLREPVESLGRADGVIITRCEQVDRYALHELDRRIAELHGRPPLGHAKHGWSAILDDDDTPVDADGSRIIAFCGIGNPEPFFHEAKRRFDVVEAMRFGDHQHYDRAFVDMLNERIATLSPSALLTTEKDWVKLQPLLESWPLRAPLWRPRLDVTFLDGEAELTKRLLAAARPESDS
jgi:tetraacyldisaccharide 4'-kinase